MNRIEAAVDVCEYTESHHYLNFRIDDLWLDERLEEKYPNRSLKGLIPCLLFEMEIDSERDIVLKRILPEINKTVVCPILMCPDDCDFSGTLVVVEIENFGEYVSWNRIGLDITKSHEEELVGSEVDWFDKMEKFSFTIDSYESMLNRFEVQYYIDQEDWKRRCEELNRK